MKQIIGGGLPPIETSFGWLLIYHGVNETATGKVYHAKAALFHLEKPEMELSRLPYPLFSPTKKWEKRVSLIMLCFLLVMPCLEMTFISTMAPLTCILQSLRLALLNA
jgi:predicted GH43/DUF377 family glycosyl hydrolase